MKKREKIFIAGAAGMVGSAIIRKLLFLEYSNLVGNYHSRMPDAAAFLHDGPTGTLPDGLRLVQVDLTSQEAVNRFFTEENPAYVVIAAAKVGGIQANNTYPAQFIYDNLAIQGNIIHAAYRNGVDRLLFLGSSCIYPKLAPQPMKEEHLLTGLLEPTNEPYAIAKIAGIKMCESYNRQYGTRFFAVMPTNLYGTNDNFDLGNSHVLPALIRKIYLAKLAENKDWEGIHKDEACFGPITADIKASLNISSPTRQHPNATSESSSSKHTDRLSADQLKSLPANQPSSLSPQHSAVTIWGTGSTRREFLHVDDMADACVFVMNMDEKTLSGNLLNYPKPSFVNVGSGVDTTIKELAEIIRKVVGFEGKLVFDTSKPDGAPQKLLDVSRLAELGWRSTISLAEGIQQTYDWYLNQLDK